MGELHFSYATPHHDKVYFNFEEEVSELISGLNNAKKQIFNIYPKKYDLAQKITTHSLKILPKIKNADIYTFWFYFNQNDYISFSQQLKQFLIRIWRNNHLNYDYKEENILSILLTNNNLQEFSKINFSALFSKLYNKQFVIIIDIINEKRNNEQSSKLNEIFNLIECIQNLKETLNINTIVLNNNSLYNANNIQLEIDNQKIKPYLEMLKQVDSFNKIETNEITSENLNKLSHIINPLIMLNQTVSTEIINYIANSNNSIETEIVNLINNNLVKQNFYNTGYNLTIKSIEKFKKNNINELDLITANGSKILSFQSPFLLLNNDFSIKTLKNAHRENFMLIDILSSLLTSKIKNNNLENELYDISYSLSNEVVDILNTNNEYHTKILITYFSQLFLKNYNLEYKYFKLLENLTYGLSNFTENVYSNDNNKKYNISRWITNLGYIYDEMNYSKVDREKIYYNAAQRISKIGEFTNETIELKTKYTLAWQFKDANRINEAVNTFLETAKKNFYKFKNNELGKPIYLVHEMYWLGYVISEIEKIKSDFLDNEILQNILNEHPIFYSHIDISRFIKKGSKYINFYNNQTYNVFFCIYDLYTAIVLSYQLIVQKKCNVKLILVHKKENIKLGTNNIIIGAPDSPDGIGEYIKHNDKDLTSLYQIRLFDNFYEVSENKNFTILMGCGLGSMIDGLNQLLETIKEGENIMDFGLLLPLIQQAGNKLWDITLDTIGDAVKKKLQDALISKDEIEKEIINLKNIDNFDREQNIQSLFDIDNKLIQHAFRETILDSKTILEVFKNVSKTELRTFDEIENLNKICLDLIDYIRNHEKASIEVKNDLFDARNNLLDIKSELNKIKRNRHNLDYSKLNKININQTDIISNIIEDYIQLIYS